MSKLDEKVYDFIVSYKRKNDGLSPSYREIGRYLDASSTSVVKNVLTHLQNNNRIEIIPGKAAGIMIVGGHWSMASEERPTYKPEPVKW